MLIALVHRGYGQTANITQGCFPLTVSFTAPGGQSGHFWDFADGATSTLPNPSNTFLNAGTYVVEFRNSANGPVVGTVTINVYPKPVPTFTADPDEGCNPLTVQFTDVTALSSGITINGYSWVFEGGGTASGPNPTHVFSPAGTYYVSLGLTTNLTSCNSTLLYDDFITVNPAPVSSFTTSPSPALACVPPLTVNFTNTSTGTGLTYEWDMGNGNTYTSQTPPAQTYTTAGTYIVKLVVTDASGCTQTTQRVVNIGQPTTSFTVPSTVCIDTDVPLVNTSSSGFYQWVFDAGASLAVSTLQNPVVSYSTPGQHSITLTTSSTNGLCSSDTTIIITVEDPSAEFTSTPDYACSDPMVVSFNPTYTGPATYEWTFGNDSTSTLQNPVITYYNDDSLYTINGERLLTTTLILTTSAGCKDTVMYDDTLHLPNARLMPDVAEGCVPLTVTFADSSYSNENITNWTWIYGDGNSDNTTNGNNQTHTYNQVGEYHAYLEIVNSAGCKDTSYSILIKVGDVLTPDFSVDKTDVCPGETVQFTDLTTPNDSIDAWHYTTEGNRMFSCFQEPNPSWVFDDLTGPQSVTLTVGYNGCYSSATQSALINVKGPIAKMHYTCNCTNPFDVNFTSNSLDATSVEWDFGDGQTSTNPTETHTYSATGNYTVILKAMNGTTGCIDSYDTAVVNIRDIQAAFTSDTLLCRGIPSPFNASQSQDVHADCNAGYTWFFGDPDKRPITTANPNEPIFFDSTGVNDVTLVVTDINGCKDTASTTVVVSGVDAVFTQSDTHLCVPNDVVFTDLSTSDTTITSWGWSFGDFTFSTQQNVTHTYTSNLIDTFQVIFVVQNELGCVDSAFSMVTRYTPTSTIAPTFTNLCAGASVNFSATDFTGGGSNLSYNWNFNDGTPNSTAQNPSHVFANGGTFNVQMTYTEVGTGCSGVRNATVNVQNYPDVSFTTSVDTLSVLCNPENVLFTNTTPANAPQTLSWNFGNGQTAGNTPTPGTVYSINGEYDAILTVTTSFGCSDTASRHFIVVGPLGDFFIDKDTICRGEEITFTIFDTSDVDIYTWDFGDGNTDVNVSPISHTYTFVPPSGQTVAKLIVASGDGECPVQKEVDIYIHEVIAGFDRNDEVDTALCFQPFPLTNTSQNANIYYWDFGDGQTSNSGNVSVHDYAAPGTYEIVLGVKNSSLGCTDTLSKVVILHPYPEVEALGDTICLGDNGTLTVETAEPTSTYQWSSPSTVTINNADQSTANSQPQVTTEYEVYVTDTNTCSKADTTLLYVILPPEVEDFVGEIVIGDSLFLPVELDTSFYIYNWDPEDGLSCLQCPNPYVQPMEDIVYTLTASDILGCFETDVVYTITIHPETFIKMPTTFTPNGDGTNDVIYVEGWGIKELDEYKIYNRWGELLFETTDKEVGWDGYYKGVLQNSDVYVFKVSAQTWRDETQTLEGYINLMR